MNIQQARAKVNTLAFGTKEWEAAMQEVRRLADEENSVTDFGEQTSVDGDVWSV